MFIDSVILLSIVAFKMKNVQCTCRSILECQLQVTENVCVGLATGYRLLTFFVFDNDLTDFLREFFVAGLLCVVPHGATCVFYRVSSVMGTGDALWRCCGIPCDAML